VGLGALPAYTVNLQPLNRGTAAVTVNTVVLSLPGLVTTTTYTPGFTLRVPEYRLPVLLRLCAHGHDEARRCAAHVSGRELLRRQWRQGVVDGFARPRTEIRSAVIRHRTNRARAPWARSVGVAEYRASYEGSANDRGGISPEIWLASDYRVVTSIANLAAVLLSKPPTKSTPKCVAYGGRMAKANRGFASMDGSKQREIASKGGRAAHEKGTAHEWTSEEARVTGRKGGLASRGRVQELVTGQDKAAAALSEPIEFVIGYVAGE
jgi:general stress protein YciG